MKKGNVLLAGVGGQGILLAGRIIADCAFNAGLDVKTSEVHGMAQRGGSVVSHIRFGPRVASALIPPGRADVILAMEELEGLRALGYLRKNGIVVLNRRRIEPRAAAPGAAPYPDKADELIAASGAAVASVDAAAAGRDLGNPRVENVVLVGLLSRYLPFSGEEWIRAVNGAVAEGLRAVNAEAFARGAAEGGTGRG